MWYRWMKFEGLVFLPVFMAYYTLKGVRFFTKCTNCGRLLLDQIYIRLGICEGCLREMVLSEPGKFDKEETVSPAPHYKTPLEPLYEMMAKKLSSGKILDVGSRDGYMLSKLRPGMELYGIDISGETIKIARDRVRRANFCQGDIRNMPFKSDTFDYLICTEVLEHIPGNDAIREMYRLLKPNGIALISVPNGKGVWGKYFPAHIQLFTYGSLVDFVKEAGFEITSGQKFGLHIPFVTRFLTALPYALGRDLPFSPMPNIRVPESLAADFFIECRKPANQRG